MLKPRDYVNYEDKGRLGAPVSQADRNSWQHRFAFSALNTSVVDPSLYYEIRTRGRCFGLNPLSDARAALIVHVDQPGNPFYMGLGAKKTFPSTFERLLLERPTQPAVPSRSDLFYLLDVSEDPAFIDYGPIPAGAFAAGADNIQGAGEVAVTSLGAAGALTALLAAQAGRSQARIRNIANGSGADLYITRTTAGPVTEATDTGLIEKLAPGELSDPINFTGAIYGWASAAGCVALPWGVY